MILPALLIICSCSTKQIIATERPIGTVSAVDSIYYNGFLEVLKSYQDSIKIVSKSWKFKGKDMTFNGIKVDPDTVGFVPIDKLPVAIKTYAPQYPKQASDEKLEGIVWVKMWIDEKGDPKLVTILKSTNKIFNQPALIAAINWVFTPGLMDNKPVGAFVSIPFKYKL